MAELSWWRITVADDGRVVACMPVERGAKNGLNCYYVQARDQKAAAKAAFNAYYRDRQARQRAELTRQGKCRWCGRTGDRGTKRCTRCLAKDVEYQQRKRDKAAGRAFVPADRAAARADRALEEREKVVVAAAPALRLEVLLEVQQAWQDAPTNGAFTRWLTEQIRAAGGVRRVG